MRVARLLSPTGTALLVLQLFAAPAVAARPVGPATSPAVSTGFVARGPGATADGGRSTGELRGPPPAADPTGAAGSGTAAAAVNTGTQKTLAILVSFTDQPAGTSAAQWQANLFGATSSVADYYKEVSYNQLTLAPAAETNGTVGDGVVGWLALSRNHPNLGSSSNPTAIRALTQDAVSAADSYVDFAQYDANGNGYITPKELHILVVAAGFEAAYAAGMTCGKSLWYSWWSGGAGTGVSADGVYVGNSGASLVGERHCDTPGTSHLATIGPMAHDLGYDLGLTALWDEDGSSNGVGDWSLMGTGNWLAAPGGFAGSSPAHLDPFSKSYEGWLTPTRSTGSDPSVSLQQAETSPRAVQLLDNPNGVDTDIQYYDPGGVAPPSLHGEYFLVENRQRTGYDAGLPGCGVLIWHVREWQGRVAENSYDTDRLVDLEEADGLNQLDTKANRGDAGDPYPGTSGNNRFDGGSNPNSNLHSGATSGVTVKDFTPCAATMGVDLISPFPPRITDFTPTSGTVGTTVTITGRSFSGATGVRFNDIYSAGNEFTSFTVAPVAPDGTQQITATLGYGARSGPITVTTPSGTAASDNQVPPLAEPRFTVLPKITRLYPATGPEGTDFQIDGSNLGSATAAELNGTSLSFAPQGPADGYGSLTTRVPTGATTGSVTVTTPDGTATSPTSFTIPPRIDDVSPLNAAIGFSPVHIYGRVLTGATSVTFNGTAATFSVVSYNEITATVPAGATTGPVRVTTPGGTAASPTDFNVTAPPPANDDFADAQVITGASGSVTGTNGSATLEPGEPSFAAGVPVDRSVWYRWTPAASGSVTMDTVGSAPSSFNTVLAVYTGNAVGSLTPVASNDDISGTNNKSRLSFTARANTVYQVAVEGKFGYFGSIALNWSQTVSTFNLSVAKSGSGTGTVTSSPAGINCGATCSQSFADGTGVTLTATPDAGASFTGWAGACTNPTGTCTVTMDAARSVTAKFAVPPTVTGFSPTSGPAGSAVTVNGTALTGATSVTFNGTAATFTVVSANQITATVPAGATTGLIRVTTPGGTAASGSNFTVTSTGATTYQEGAAAVQLNGWRGVTDPAASGGSYRVSKVTNDTVTFKFTGTGVTWVTRKAPDQGKAVVTIDGVAKGTFDLYSATVQASVAQPFSGLANAAHTMVVKVLGQKNATATAFNVAVDAFVVGASTTQDGATRVQYAKWLGTAATTANGGAYRSAGISTATALLKFTGTGVDLVTAKGPTYGLVNVFIDNMTTPRETIDLYAAAQTWKFTRAYTGLAAGAHTIKIKCTGTKNASSTGTKAVLDAFVVH